MADLIGTVTGTISLSKQLLEIAAFAKDAKAKLIVAELEVQLSEVKSKLACLIDENVSLKQELKKLTSSVPEVILRDGLYFKEDGDGPFCTTCFDDQGKLIRVVEQTGLVRRDIGKWKCNVCRSFYA